jgi:hypothetical protein
VQVTLLRIRDTKDMWFFANTEGINAVPVESRDGMMFGIWLDKDKFPNVPDRIEVQFDL